MTATLEMREMTLAELQAETLVEKNRRLLQAKCEHEAEAVSSFTFCSAEVTFTDTVCVDCGKHWRKDHP